MSENLNVVLTFVIQLNMSNTREQGNGQQTLDFTRTSISTLGKMSHNLVRDIYIANFLGNVNISVQLRFSCCGLLCMRTNDKEPGENAR